MSEENIVNNEEILEEPQDLNIDGTPVEETPEDTGPKWYEYENANEVDFIGTKFIKPDYDQDAYTTIAGWCNETQKAFITESEDGTYYECVALPEPTTEDLKERKLRDLEFAFEEAVKGSFTTTEGYTMQFDISDSIKMQGAITLMETLGQTEGYLTQANDETVYNVSLATMKEVLVEMLSAYAQCHAHKQELRTLINNAKTKEELDSIQITWPV